VYVRFLPFPATHLAYVPLVALAHYDPRLHRLNHSCSLCVQVQFEFPDKGSTKNASCGACLPCLAVPSIACLGLPAVPACVSLYVYLPAVACGNRLPQPRALVLPAYGTELLSLPGSNTCLPCLPCLLAVPVCLLYLLAVRVPARACIARACIARACIARACIARACIARALCLRCIFLMCTCFERPACCTVSTVSAVPVCSAC